MRFKNLFAAFLIGILYVLFVPAEAQAQTCYTVNITIENASGADVPSFTVNFSRGDPFMGTLVIGPVVGQVGPVPDGGQRSAKLTGSWNRVPDNVVIGPGGAGITYSASVSEGCGDGDSEPAYTLPGLPTNTQQGFILPPEAGDGDDDAGENFELWLIDADGNGFKALEFSPEELAALPELPDSNQTILEGEGFAFYVLTTGEFQVNFGPTADGWYDVVVFNRDFEVTNTYRTR